MRQPIIYLAIFLTAAGSGNALGIFTTHRNTLIKQEDRVRPTEWRDYCYWDGTAPFCDGSCPSGYQLRGKSNKGDGQPCWTGDKWYCCHYKDVSARGDRILDTEEKNEKVHATAKDDFDDYCPEGEVIMCPIGATKNEECICVKDSDTTTSKAHREV